LGFQVREIGDAAYRHRQEVESGDRTIVGVNRFTTEEPPIEGLLRVNEEATRIQIQRLERLRKERDGGKVKAALERLEQVAKTEENTVPVILECVENHCTLGEISQVFRGVFGEQEGILTF
ncbi:MAG: methylmalonyl-CoA mutase, partial [Chloroflexi bacterium]|nr:methylmalonyl-CoA mutase [Chloroflexota bacterium]